jgi:hypothetical protein
MFVGAPGQVAPPDSKHLCSILGSMSTYVLCGKLGDTYFLDFRSASDKHTALLHQGGGRQYSLWEVTQPTRIQAIVGKPHSSQEPSQTSGWRCSPGSGDSRSVCSTCTVVLVGSSYLVSISILESCRESSYHRSYLPRRSFIEGRLSLAAFENQRLDHWQCHWASKECRKLRLCL